MHMEVCPYSYFRWCRYLWGPWVSFVTKDEFSVRVTKITSRIGVSRTHILPFCFWFIFNLINYGHITKKDVNQLTLNHTTLWNLTLQVFEAFTKILLNVNLSLNQTPLVLLLYVRQIWMIQLILSISLWGFTFFLIQKDSITHMHSLAVYVKEGVPFAHNLSLENFVNSHLCFWLALLHSVSYFFFPLSITFFVFMHGFGFCFI